jgi:hypothetical protein
MVGMGDVRLAEAVDYQVLNQFIVRACGEAYADERNRKACNVFVAAVARKLGLHVDGLANDIYEEIEDGTPWMNCGRGFDGAVKAAYYARQGYFVVAAWENPADDGNGHVAVVTGFGHAKGAITSFDVLASWGVLNRPAKHLKGIRWAFNVHKKFPDVIFGAQFIRRFS